MMVADPLLLISPAIFLMEYNGTVGEVTLVKDVPAKGFYELTRDFSF